MNIIEAAKQLQQGYKVRRKCWLEFRFSDDLYLQIPLHTREIVPMVYSPSFEEPLYPYSPTTEDYLANDWEVTE